MKTGASGRMVEGLGDSWAAVIASKSYIDEWGPLAGSPATWKVTAVAITVAAGIFCAMGKIRTAVIVGVCIAPSAAFSIGPQLAGVANGSTAVVAFLILQTAATIALAWCSHEAGQAETIGKRLACFGFVLVLGFSQFWAALEVSSHKVDDKAAVASKAISGSAALAEKLTAARNSRNQLPLEKQTPVSATMVESAKSAVTAAERIAKAECEKRGPKCADREADERNARTKLDDLEGRFAIFDRIEKLEQEERDTGAAPAHLSGDAYRIGRIISIFFDIGRDDKERTEAVLDWQPTFKAFIVELIAGGLPYALSRKPDAPRKKWRWPTIRLPRRRRTTEAAPVSPIAEPLTEPAAPAAAVEKTAVRKTPAKPKKVKVSKAAAATPARDWHVERTVARDGADMKPSDAYADYKLFAEGRGETAMTLTAFGIAMRDEIKQDMYTTPSNRKFYRGIALAGRPTLRAVK